jgi:hypothetical protein
MDLLKYDLKYTSNCKVVFFILPYHDGVRPPPLLRMCLSKTLAHHGVNHRPSNTGASELAKSRRPCVLVLRTNDRFVFFSNLFYTFYYCFLLNTSFTNSGYKRPNLPSPLPLSDRQ